MAGDLLGMLVAAVDENDNAELLAWNHADIGPDLSMMRAGAVAA
jgi:hypothetical protein